MPIGDILLALGQMNKERIDRNRESEFLNTVLSSGGGQPQGNEVGAALRAMAPQLGIAMPDAAPTQEDFSAQAKSADGYGAVLQHNFGVDPAQLKTMSLEQKRGLLRKHEMETALQEHQAKLDDFKAQTAERQAQAALRNQMAQQEAALGTAINRYGSGDMSGIPPELVQYAQSSGSMPAVMAPELYQQIAAAGDPAARMKFALQTPGLGGTGAERLLSTLTKLQEAQGVDVVPKEFNIGGMRGIYNPKGGNFQFNPADLVGLKTEAERDKLDMKYPNGLPAKIPSSFDPLMDSVSAEISGYRAMLQKPDDEFANPKAAKEARARAQRNLDSATKRGRDAVDRLHSRKLLTDDERDDHYTMLGVGGSQEASPAAASSGMVRVVSPNGQTGSIPASQLEAAKAKGFKEAK